MPEPKPWSLYAWSEVKPFVVAQTSRSDKQFYLMRIRYNDEGTEHRLYRLLTDYPLIRGKYEDIGGISFAIFGDSSVAQIYGVALVEEFQGQGLGTFIYKTAINDLVSQGYRVQSDTARSPQANRVWLNLQQRNPDTVKVIPRLGGRTVYEARGVVHRRPNVKRHWRSR